MKVPSCAICGSGLPDTAPVVWCETCDAGPFCAACFGGHLCLFAQRKPPAELPMFDGADYDPRRDERRLRSQNGRIFRCMRDGVFRTLEEIAELTGDPPASISAQLRHLRKKRFGGYKVEKRPRGDRRKGLYEYRLLVPVASATAD